MINKFAISVFLIVGFSFCALAQIDYQLFVADKFSYDYECSEFDTWIASESGLIRINHSTSEIDHYTPLNSELEGVEVIEVELGENNIIWVATKYAIHSFDGENWEKFSVYDGQFTKISNLRISDEGTVWFLFDKELYSLKDGELKNHSSFFSDEIRGFDLHSDGLIYAYEYPSKVYRFDGSVSVEILTASNFIGRILDGAIDKNGDFIFYTAFSDYQLNINSNHLYKYSISNGTVSEIYNGDSINSFYSKSSFAFIKDNKNDLWVQFHDQYPESTKLLKLTEDGIENFTYESLGFDLPNDDGEYLLMDIDNENNFWLRKNQRNISDRIFKVNASSFNIYNLDFDYIISSNEFAVIGEDCEGNIIALSPTGYVYTFNGINWTRKSFLDVLPNNSSYQYTKDFILNPINCEMWWDISTTNNEILVLKDGEFSLKNIGAVVIQMEVAEDGTSYILTGDGLLVIEADGNEILHPNEDLPFISGGRNSMVLANDNNLWFLMNQNIYRFNDEGWKVFEADGYPFVEDYYNDIQVDELGNLWTYYQDGFAIFDGANWELIPFEYGEYFPRLHYEDKNNKMWAAGHNGLYIFDGLTFERLQVSNSPICSNSIFDIHFAENLDIWFVHVDGITRLNTRFQEANNKIGGIAFYDHNQDGTYDFTEDARLSNQRIINQHNNEVTYTNSSGGYAFGVDGQISSSVEITPEQDWMSISPSILNYEVDNNNVVDLDFALFNDQLEPDISLDLVGAPSICNGVTNFWITIKNEGIETQVGTISFSFDELYSFESSNQETSLEELTYIEWEFENLRYTESKTFVVSLATPTEDNFGEFFSFNATLSTEDLMIEKEVEIFEELFCSYDPNDKLSKSTGDSYGEYSFLNDALEYTIRFQNFGNYPARKVVIIDTLDQHLDVNSFELVSHSHEVATTIVEGNIVLFKFEDINLPFESEDPAGSNGFIKYRIKAKDDTPSETMVRNTASIYFDFNAGIRTNTTENVLVDVLPLSSTKELVEDIFTIFPNPSNREFIISSENDNQEETVISIFNLHGKLISKYKTSSFPVSLNIETNGMHIVTINEGGNLHSYKVVKTD